MKERPILLRPWEIHGLLNGQITHLWRPIPRLRCEQSDGVDVFIYHDRRGLEMSGPLHYAYMLAIECEYGKSEDRLWGRETYKLWPNTAGPEHRGPDDMGAIYRATWDKSGGHGWRSATTMPRWAARIVLEIIAVDVRDVQSITEEDARAAGTTSIRWAWWDGFIRIEGRRFHRQIITNADHPGDPPEEMEHPELVRDETGAVVDFRSKWWGRYAGTYPWSDNPWAWVLEVKPI